MERDDTVYDSVSVIEAGHAHGLVRKLEGRSGSPMREIETRCEVGLGGVFGIEVVEGRRDGALRQCVQGSSKWRRV